MLCFLCGPGDPGRSAPQISCRNSYRSLSLLDSEDESSGHLQTDSKIAAKPSFASLDRLPKTRSPHFLEHKRPLEIPLSPTLQKTEPFLSRTKNERSKNWLRLHPLPFGRKSLGPSLKPIPKNNPKPHPRPTRRQKQNKIASDGRQSPACSPSLPKIEDFPSLLPSARPQRSLKNTHTFNFTFTLSSCFHFL